MKKVTVAIWMILYLAVSSGIVVNSHYCMNRLASTQLFVTQSKVCGKCGMHTDKSHGCCRDEVKVVKMDEDQKLVAVFNFELPAIEAIVNIPSTFIAASFYNTPVNGSEHNHSPPLLSAQDSYLQYCVFRI